MLYNGKPVGVMITVAVMVWDEPDVYAPAAYEPTNAVTNDDVLTEHFAENND